MSETPKRVVPPSLVDMKQLPAKLPVKFLKFRDPTDIPGEQVCERVKSDPSTTLETQRRWTVNYLTAMQLFEIMYHPADQRQPVEVAYIGRECVRQWTLL